MTGFLKRWLGGEPKYPRSPRFAGHMYPEDGRELAETVDGWLGGAGRGAEVPVGLIVPFGELEYVGATAGAAWASVRAHASGYERVLLVSSAQRIPFRGPAVAGYDVWRTPLGDLRADADALNALMGCEDVRQLDEAHAQEAALELTVPFIQRVLPGVELVPLLMGDGGVGELEEAFELGWTEGTLAVVVTELSREEELADASRRDRQTAEALVGLEADRIDRRAASARVPLRALVEITKRRGGRIEERALGTSADVDGRTVQVIGYGSFVVY